MTFYCYMLYTDAGQTYIGATVDVDRRLRQHNKEIKGGAVATGIRVAQGATWKRACYIPVPEWRTALQIEWRWKQLSRKFPAKMFPLERRIKALIQLLKLDKPTSKSVPYSEWTTKPEVIFEIDDALNLYNKYNLD